jgi:hypothetical protein
MRWLVYAFALATVVCSPRALATQAPRLPVAEWTAETRLDLARSVVGEAGWDAYETGEAVAIAEVYRARWLHVRRTWPTASYRSIVRAYSRALDGRRRVWVTTISYSTTRPRGWPGNLRWEPYRKRLVNTAKVLDTWQAGGASTPCPGANHFGGPMDQPWRGLQRVACVSPTRNTFYRR